MPQSLCKTFYSNSLCLFSSFPFSFLYSSHSPDCFLAVCIFGFPFLFSCPLCILHYSPPWAYPPCLTFTFSSVSTFSASLYVPPYPSALFPTYVSIHRPSNTGNGLHCSLLADGCCLRDSEQHRHTRGVLRFPHPRGRTPGGRGVLRTADGTSTAVFYTDFLCSKMWLTEFYTQEQRYCKTTNLISHTWEKSSFGSKIPAADPVHLKRLYFSQVMPSQMRRWQSFCTTLSTFVFPLRICSETALIWSLSKFVTCIPGSPTQGLVSELLKFEGFPF